MVLNLPVTLTIIGVVVVLFAFANWRARQPAEPLKVRMITPSMYNVIQMACIVALLYLLVHVLGLVWGLNFPGRQGGGRPF
jgi:hypothetical protein